MIEVVRMQVSRPAGLLAGFHANCLDDALSELGHAGEQWTPRNFHIRRHSHPAWELFYQVDGWSTWEDELGAQYRVDKCDLLAMPPGLVHWLKEVQSPGGGSLSDGSVRQHFLYAMIDIDGVLGRHAQLARDWLDKKPRLARDVASVLAPFRILLHEVSADRPFRPVALAAAIDLLVIEATRAFSADRRCAASVLMHPAVALAQQLIDQQYDRKWTLAGLSAECGVSPHHLVDLFTRHIGVPPHRYLTRTRLENARDALSETDIGVADLALELGFSSGQHFATAFKRFTGLSPYQYRQAVRTGAAIRLQS